MPYTVLFGSMESNIPDYFCVFDCWREDLLAYALYSFVRIYGVEYSRWIVGLCQKEVGS